jgi:hypothetical protein
MRGALLLACALGATSAAAAEPKLPELKLRYAAAWNKMNLGEIVVTLQPDEQPDCYRYQSDATPVGMVRWVYGKPREVSRFCVSGGKVVPKHFSYEARDGFTLEFDVAAGKVKDSRGQVRDLPANAQDRFGLQQAMRLWLITNQSNPDPGPVEFAMVDDDRVRVYKFAITARERIEIPAGAFDTIRVERIDNKKRISRFWIAPSRDWMPVKVESGKNGKVQLRMELKDK